jgi:prepilin-type processing-associated H-X9-DG protein
MAENAQEQLLGYLLDALEDDERQQIQQDLANDPQLRGQLETLRAVLAPMESSRELFDPPPGLARRTCRYVAAQIAGSKSGPDRRPTPAGRLHAMRPDFRLDGGSSRFSWLDLVAVAGILMAAWLLIFPALHNSRVQARTTECNNNLRNLYVGLAHYSDAFNGNLPSAAPSDRLGVGGGFAVVLQSTGYLEDPRHLICPDSPMAEVVAFSIPTPEQILIMPEGEELEVVQASMGGSYSMSLGYEEANRFRGLRNRGRDDFALISDVPEPGAADFRSHNHAGGRNILFGGGNVRFVVVPVAMIGSDHVFLNAAGRIGPGLNPHDSVIPPAGPLPIVYASNRR